MSEESPIARMQRRLRADTAKLLDLDPNNLTPAQSVRLDRAASLRLQLDDIQAAQLRGEQIDMPRFILASKELEVMLGGQPDASPTFDADKVAADLEKSIQSLIDVRASKAAEAEAEIPDPDGGDAHRNLDAQWDNRPPAAAGSNLPAPIRQPNNVVPIDGAARANANLPPAHYLRDGQREPWRDYQEGRVTGPSPWPLPR
jgi:hypothetical protein